MNLDIRTEEKDHRNILYVGGEIDAYTASQLREALLPLTEKDGTNVIVDLSGVDYIDSTGLGIFIGALKSSNSNNTTLKLIGLNSRVKRLFSITGLDEVMDIDEEREEAK
ncbi:STAS domain-containing protein [Alteribacillus bidgolensis]|uniref:Anti-sigma factor antagonist n=1 Tax=Alteribacillus bidgolensis TaxID=930129 RepID=A0A1G8ITX7_9BACI|nr:STAS domain-containing protein [Alteribacillus bidgolensis]SDI21920.1 anti-sigma B factor antagonist [Alteribacillus bidgolensis]